MTENLIQIDGSTGEGGGQIIRTSLALSMVTGKAIEISNIRSKRKNPGLQNQHLTAVKAAQQVCGADVQGLELHSQRLKFVPGEIHAGNYFFDVGTAGSTTLVFQTILYPLLLLNGKSTVRVKGGTHNPFAPTFEFLHKTFLPVLNKFGYSVSVELIRHGFYPRGGGELKFEIEAYDPQKSIQYLDLTAPEDADQSSACVILAGLPEHIARRELKLISEELRFLQKTAIVETKDSLSAGNVVNIFSKTENLTETFSELGKRGVPAEKVAQLAVDEYKRYRKSRVPVGQHLADQILLPLVLSNGGKYLTLKPSNHTLTNIDTIKNFLNPDILVEEIDEDQWLIEVKKELPSDST